MGSVRSLAVLPNWLIFRPHGRTINTWWQCNEKVITLLGHSGGNWNKQEHAYLILHIQTWLKVIIASHFLALSHPTDQCSPPQPPWHWSRFSFQAVLPSLCFRAHLPTQLWAEHGAYPVLSLLFSKTAAYYCLIPFQTATLKSEYFGFMPVHARSCPESYL